MNAKVGGVGLGVSASSHLGKVGSTGKLLIGGRVMTQPTASTTTVRDTGTAAVARGALLLACSFEKGLEFVVENLLMDVLRESSVHCLEPLQVAAHAGIPSDFPFVRLPG